MDIVTKTLLGENNPEPVESHEDDTRNELTLKVIDEVFSKKDIEVKTELNDNQIINFSRGHIFHTLFNAPRMLELINTISIYSVSKQRKGRKEFTDIAKAVNSYNPDFDESPRLRDRLVGKGF